METKEAKTCGKNGPGRRSRASAKIQATRNGSSSYAGLSKCHKFSIIIDNIKKDEDKTPPPFIAVQLGKKCQQTYAFIDFGGDGNTISYELF